MGVSRLWVDFRQDIALGVRLARRNIVSTGVVVFTLAVAIGANTAVFSAVNALLFKPLPFVAAPHELARVKAGELQMAWANYEDLRRDSGVFTHLAAQRSSVVGVAIGDRPIRFVAVQTSGNFFTTLGSTAAAGRTYTASEARSDVVVISADAWRTRFGSDPSLVGRILTLGGRPYEVIGIMPSGFRGLSPPGWSADCWFPIDTTATPLAERRESAFEVAGRLRPGVSRREAAAFLQVFARRMRAEHPEIPDQFVNVSVLPVDGLHAFEGMARTLLPAFAFLGTMTILAGLVLLIACANVAGIQLGRAAGRRREIAMRLALGAGRGRLVRQLLTENLVPAVLAGAGGYLLATVIVRLFPVVTSSFPIGREIDLHPDGRVLIYTLGVTIVTIVATGLAPARRAARFDVMAAIKDGHDGATARQRLRRALVVTQVAATTALLVWSGLFVRSLDRVTEVHPGFDPAGVLLTTVTFDRDTAQAGPDVLTALQQRVAESRGVQSAGLASIVPLAMTGREEFDVGVGDASGATSRRRVFANRLGPGWFETVRIPFVAGRDFTWADREGAARVVIVNQTLAHQFWNGAALGQQVVLNRQRLDVVGVVRDSKYWTLGETVAPIVYLPFRQGQPRDMTLHVRTVDPAGTSQSILAEMQRLAPDRAIEIETMSSAVAGAIRPAQIGAAATTAFAILAMLQSALGVYGLVSFLVSQRLREIGVRKALGASTRDVVRLIAHSVARLTAAGLAAGITGGLLGAMTIRGFLFGVSPLDPVTVVSAIAIIGMTALAASVLPARSAVRVDPAAMLRTQ